MPYYHFFIQIKGLLMVLYKPCFHCPQKTDCEMRSGMGDRLKQFPIRLTTVKVSCPIFNSLFAPGDRVKAKIGGVHTGFNDVTGTILLRKDAKFLIQADIESAEENTGFFNEGDYGETSESGPRYFIRVYADRITSLPEPSRFICANCGNACDAKGDCITPPGKPTQAEQGYLPCAKMEKEAPQDEFPVPF